MEDQKTIKYIKLPFYGESSYKIRNQLMSILKDVYKDILFTIIFVNKLPIGSFFPTKDPYPKGLYSNVIYNYSCPKCNLRYVGSTCWNLKT